MCHILCSRNVPGITVSESECIPLCSRFTYLDTMIGGGRPLITFRKRNVISLHTESFEIEYVYDSTRIYFKPALIIGGLFAFFVAVMTLSRISPSLEVPRGGGGGSGEGADGEVIRHIMAMQPDQLTPGRLEKVSKKLDDEIAKKKVESTIEEMKRIVAKNKASKRGRNRGDDVDLKANIGALLKALQNNL